LVRTGADLGPWLVERRVTAISTVPGLLALWPDAALDRVRLLVVGGEDCPGELVERLGAGREMWNTYGPTETAVVACACRLRPGEPVRIGRPLDGWMVAVVDPHGRPVPWGATGQLVIAGVGTARYLDDARDTEAFGTHPVLDGRRAYRTGDLVRADPQGLVFLGRVDDQVKLAGRRVELGEIDGALRELPGVRAAAAAVRSTTGSDQVLVGYVVPERPSGDGAPRFDVAAARDRLGTRLPAALVPRIVVVDDLPRRTSGKIDRRALPWPPQGDDGPHDDALDGTAAWLAARWRRLLGVAVTGESDFFAVGGTSLTAARLVSALRERYPEVSVTDVYRHPTLRDLADRLDAQSRRSEPHRVVRPTPRRTGVLQFLFLVVLSTVAGLRWLLVLATLNNLAGPLAGTARLSWWLIVVSWLGLYSAPARVGISAGAARLLTSGVRPGTHQRGGSVHLRVWAAERIATTMGIPTLLGTPWAALFARAVGCSVGRDVVLHAPPPVTGLADFGDGCAVEPEADVSGWWLDGDAFRLGTVRVGAHARVAARATLLPGASVGAGADIAPGACLTAEAPPGRIWSGSPARPARGDNVDGHGPDAHGATRSRGIWWPTAYALAGLGFDAIPLLALLPALVLFANATGDGVTPTAIIHQLPWAAPIGAVLTTASYAALVALVVRVTGGALRPGSHPVYGSVAWCAWVTSRLMDQARKLLFPFYASLLTPLWLRLCGAKVGRRAEISTVLTLPQLTRIEHGAFLADDTLVAPFELRGRWLRLGRSAVGRRAFVGNSGIVGADRALPDRALVGVLSDAPAHLAPGASWLGRPGFTVPRHPEAADPRLTFHPPRHLVLMRATVEACRLVPLLCVAVLADAFFLALTELTDAVGWLAAIALVGPLFMAAGVLALLTTTAAKWLLVGRFTVGRHPLWSSFVWRNELYDTFVETLAMPWLGHYLVGTPMLNAWLRTLGAHIGRGVWLESHWLPETDLVRLDDAVSVNRGCVLQTHLFHDRLLRVDTVRLGRGATLGPHSIILPGATLGDGTVIGPSSLVMRGEHVPAGSRWLGNPVVRWHTPS
ncbi:Pls/PosA family non-ribosomal peptide synthetase, partial [Streptomyces sp. RPT161]|uniref:Pls/PosA family non-ribosomal peptide synthetase n=1 Tax=Streptomyces sp. RPT161 TaxID=3015993 RepID=UPI0022B868F6